MLWYRQRLVLWIVVKGRQRWNYTARTGVLSIPCQREMHESKFILAKNTGFNEIINRIMYKECLIIPRRERNAGRAQNHKWRLNGHDGVSNHQPHDCLLNRLFRYRSKKTPKLRVTGLCEGNSPVTGDFPAQRASKAENVSIWWRHRDKGCFPCTLNLAIDTLYSCQWYNVTTVLIVWWECFNPIISYLDSEKDHYYFILYNADVTVRLIWGSTGLG